MRARRLVPLSALLQAAIILAATVEYNWEVTWVQARPDGFNRPVIGINGAWPCPTIEATQGDTIVINLFNRLGNETTGLHFHGIDQINTNYMDGATPATQCPVPPGNAIRYSFVANQPGTYWWHAHNAAQYADGLRGPLIVRNPNEPYLGEYDYELLLVISDWYHEQAPVLVTRMLQPSNNRFLPPRPNSLIINEGGDGKFPVEPGKRYRLRIISFSALPSAFVQFKDLDMNVIMIDGSYVKKQLVRQLHIAAAQRYDVIVQAGPENTPFLVVMDTNPDYTAGNTEFRYNSTGALVANPRASIAPFSINSFEPYNDAFFQPLDGALALGPPVKAWTLNFDNCFDVNGYPRICVNGQPYISQKVPTLYSVASLGQDNVQLGAYGAVNPFIVNYGEVMDIVINNHDGGIHPFHLHGHQFQVLRRPYSNAGDWTGSTAWIGHGTPPPPRRDVINVYARSHAIIRIIADHPGVFLFHCHIEWHVEMGMTATLIEAPERLVGMQFPQDHTENCKAMGMPYTGNAGGNEVWYDTTGFVTVPPTVYTGSLWPPPTSPITGTDPPDGGPSNPRPPDGGSPSGGSPDGGSPDGGSPDRGSPSGGPPNRGPPNRGPPNRGPPNRGPLNRNSPNRGLHSGNPSQTASSVPRYSHSSRTP